MEIFIWVIIAYLILISLYGFVIMGIDKSKARKGSRRVSEKRLITIAAIGGSLGVWYGMMRFRHKTKHAKFRLGVPVILAVQVGLACWLVLRLDLL